MRQRVRWMTCQVELHSAFSSITPLLDMLFLLPFSLSFFLSLNLLLQFPFLLLFLLLLFLLSHSLSTLFLFFLLRLFWFRLLNDGKAFGACQYPSASHSACRFCQWLLIFSTTTRQLQILHHGTHFLFLLTMSTTRG